MPEVEECRYCADCCHACIFLDYDVKDKRFGCLIYKNKYRYPISSSDIIRAFKGKMPSYHISYWTNSIVERICMIVDREDDLCSGHICWFLKDKNKMLIDIRERGISESDRHRISSIREARKLIPNFNDLVVILNE